MITDDEPVLGSKPGGDEPADREEATLADRIRRLVLSQHFAVLCTHGDDVAYGSLVAFAAPDNLCTAVFATPVTTRKFRLLSEHDHVALVVDNRPERQTDMMQVEAVTATGRARRLEPGSDHDACAGLLVDRHPQLRTFVAAESCALFQVQIIRYFHVVRFQEVRQWVPTTHP